MAEQGREDRSSTEGELFRLLVENVVDYAIFVVDPEGLVRTWSHGAERLLGYTEEDILGRTADVFFTPEDVRDDIPRTERREALDTGRGDDDRWHVRKDGTRFWVSGVTTPLRDESGRLRGFAKIMRDRTEWWHAEQARLEGEGRFRTAFAHASVGMAVTDAEGRFLDANRAYCEITGYSLEELLPKDLASVTHPDDLPKNLGLIRRMLDGGDPGFVIEKRYVRKDGGIVWVKNSVSLVRDAGGRPLRIVALVEDITQRKGAEAAVAEQVRLAEFGRDLSLALAEGTTLPEMLARCAEACVRHLDGAFARIWTADQAGDVLELRASAGMYTHTDGPHARIPVGKFKIGLIAQERRPHLTNAVIGDPRVPSQDWAVREGMIGFAGYPLVVEDRLVGVLAMFARHSLSDATLRAMASVADGIAVGIVRKRAEERLQQSERELADFFENAMVGLHWVGPDGTILRATRAELDLLGYAEEEYVGRHIAEFHADEEVICDILRRLQAGETLSHRPARLRRKDGTIRDVLIDSSVRWEGGGFAHTRCFTRDVTEHRRAEEGLREQTRIAEALNRIGVLLAAELDLERLVQVVTDEATRLTDARFGAFFYNVPDEKGGAYTLYTISGVPREAFSRLPMPRATDLFGPTFRNEGVVRLDDVTQDPRFGRNAPHHGMPEGHLPVRSYQAVSVASRSGEVLGGLFFGHPEPGVFDEADERLVVGIAAQAAVAIDNARLYRELRAAKEDADAANRAKTQFLAVLSHELRTPLNPILLAASSMLDRPCDPEEIRPTLEMVRQNVNLQARLIDDLLDVMRIVQGKMPLHWGVSDCHALIRRAVEICQSEVHGRRHRLILDLSAGEHCVNADSARLQQVLWNLVKNAVKFTPEGGTITVRTRNEDAQGERIVIEVADTGIGIEPEVLPTIWDPFQQGETTITRRFGGLGLGLAICKGVVDAHGGTLEVESPGRGMGTTFRVALKTMPATDGGDCDSKEDKAPPSSPTPSLNCLRILLVEDEAATLRLMSRLLVGLGHRVTAAGTVADAWVAFEGGEFDLIVSDIGLPDGTGLDLMRKVKSVRRVVPAIALTGYGMDEDIRRSREAGFTTHMTKPIDFTKLEAMIRQVAN